MEKQKRTYSPEFKLKAVEPSNPRGSSAQVASGLDISPKNPGRWKQEHGAGKLDSNPKPTVSKSTEELENIALRKALREAELERDILKKAPCIFSKSDG
jgi:transposase